MMRTPFEVTNRSVTIDEFGTRVVTFLGVGTKIWGYLRGTAAVETMEREGMTHARSYEIMVRAKERANFAETSRLQSPDGRTFDILGIEEYDDRQQTLTIRVREVIT